MQPIIYQKAKEIATRRRCITDYLSQVRFRGRLDVLDRVLQEQNWQPGAQWRTDGSRCLVGVVMDARAPAMPIRSVPLCRSSCDYGDNEMVERVAGHSDAAWAFDCLCGLVGTDEAVRIVKSIAAELIAAEAGPNQEITFVSIAAIAPVAPIEEAVQEEVLCSVG